MPVIAMDILNSDKFLNLVNTFRLPRYTEIPDVGLYLEQTVKYISGFLDPLNQGIITASMVSNYVKKGLIANPVKKQYNREQIAYLIFIILAKNVLSLDNLSRFIALQKRTYSSQIAYDYFCREFENVLQHVFGFKDKLDAVGVESSNEKIMLRNTIIAVAHKIYLDSCFALISMEENNKIN